VNILNILQNLFTCNNGITNILDMKLRTDISDTHTVMAGPFLFSLNHSCMEINCTTTNVTYIFKPSVTYVYVMI
jgi:hypothetical protein